MDAIFDAIQTFNAMGLLFGGILVFAIGLAMVMDWVLWRIKSYKVRARVAAVKSTGQRRSDEEWEEHYKAKKRKEQEEAKKQPSFKEGFQDKPVATGFAVLFMGLFALMPFVFFGIGAYTAYDFLSLKATGIKTLGEVVDIESSYDSDSGYTYAPVMSYTDRNGYGFREKDKISTGSNKISRGEKIFLYYDANDPSHFVLDRFWRYMGFAFAFMGISSVFIGLFAFAFINRKADGTSSAASKQLKVLKRKHYANQMYTAIYEFVTPRGETIQVPGSVSSSSVADKLPGSDVLILVRPDKPEKVRKAGYLFLILGLCFVVPGIFLTGLSFKMTSFSWGGVLVIGGMLAVGAFKIISAIRRGSDKMTKEDWVFHVKERAQKEMATGYILTPAEVRERYMMYERSMRFAVPFMFLLSVGMIYGGYYWHKHISDFTATALYAEGRVVGVNSRRSDDSYMYYPVVQFKDQNGKLINFEDNVGSNPPTKRTGDEVQVLYDPMNSDNAMIDRGIWNNIPALGVLLFGILLLLNTFKVWRQQRTRRL